MAIRSQKSEKKYNYNYLIDADYLCDKKVDLQAFTETPKMGTTVFVIEDSAYYMADSSGKFVEISVGSSGGASSADEVSYDNTDSGLEADNVQDAIDELANAGGGGAFVLPLYQDGTTQEYYFEITDIDDLVAAKPDLIKVITTEHVVSSNYTYTSFDCRSIAKTTDGVIKYYDSNDEWYEDHIYIQWGNTDVDEWFIEYGVTVEDGGTTQNENLSLKWDNTDHQFTRDTATGRFVEQSD